MISSCLTTYNKLFPYRSNISNDIQNKCMYDNHIDCAMGRRGHLESDRRGFDTRSGQTKDYTIDMCCFFAKNAALRMEKEQRLVSSESG